MGNPFCQDLPPLAHPPRTQVVLVVNAISGRGSAVVALAAPPHKTAPLGAERELPPDKLNVALLGGLRVQPEQLLVQRTRPRVSAEERTF